MTTRILQGDARALLRNLTAGSVHMAVTSPPYWGLRRYAGPDAEWVGGTGACDHAAAKKLSRFESGGVSDKQLSNPGSNESSGGITSPCPDCGAALNTRGMIGNEPTPQAWCDNLVEVFRAVRRVLRDDGVLFVNCGDRYAGSGGAGGDYAEGGLKASANGTGPASSQHLVGYRPKSLLGLPWILAFALMRDGWILRQEIIWHKRSPMPESATDRPTRAHEQLFLFSKSNDATFWTHRSLPGVRTAPAPDYRWRRQDGDTELEAAPDGWAFKVEHCRCHQVKAQHWYRDNLWEGHDYYWDAEAVREPHLPESIERYARGGSFVNGRRDGAPYAMQHSPRGAEGGRSARSVQAFAPTPFSVSKLGKYGPMPEVDHYALFPVSLPTWCIRAGTSEKGVCPECGAPWVRQTKKGEPVLHPDVWSAKGAIDSLGQPAGPGSTLKHTVPVETLGWAASCAHADLPPVPATVLDCFAGAGTTMLAAEQLGRNSIGCEISPDYIRLAEARLHEAAPLLGARP